jgi:hypothetical protein
MVRCKLRQLSGKTCGLGSAETGYFGSCGEAIKSLVDSPGKLSTLPAGRTGIEVRGGMDPLKSIIPYTIASCFNLHPD